jgi:hypothetical protein
MSVAVHSHWTFIVNAGLDLFSLGDKIMRAMLDQEKCTSTFVDSAVSVDSARGLMEIEADTTGGDLSEAIATAQAVVRAALHEVGIATPDWPNHDDALSMVLKDFRTVQV